MAVSKFATYTIGAVGLAGAITAAQYSGFGSGASSSASAPVATASLATPVSPDPIDGDINASTFRNIAQQQTPIVVSIRTVSTARTPMNEFGDPRLRRFFGLPDAPSERIMEGAGSGFILDKSGLVLTNAHVVMDAERIEVALFSDPNSRDVRRYPAKVLGRDPLTDSALLQLEGAPELPVAKIGNSDAMRPGDWVVAIGNPFALSHTVTVGVISATSRPFPVEGRLQRVLQTDAAINPGNSGGPLLNLRGEVIGINTAILAAAGGTNVGVGFAVPINLVRDLVPALRQGDVRHGRMGVEVSDVPSEARQSLGLTDNGGALVATVERGGPAERAGLQPGDVIISVDNEPIDSSEEIVHLIGSSAPGAQKKLTIVRDKTRRDITVTLDELKTAAGSSSRSTTESAEGLGITLAPVTPEVARQLQLQAGQGAAVVTEVRRASPAAESGLAPGDVILEVNRQAVTEYQDAISRLRASASSGQPTFLLVQRGTQRVFIVIGRGR